MTSEGSAGPPPDDSETPEPDRGLQPASPASGVAPRTTEAPAGGVFSLEGRPAPGLYAVGWLLAPLGAVLLLVALLSGSGLAGRVAAALAITALLLGFAAAAGYQVIARRDRPAGAYRGPAPLLVLGFVLALANLVGLALVLPGLVDFETTPGFLVGVLVPFGCYLVGLTLLVVRTDALSWQAMLRLRPGRVAGRVGDFLVGAGAGIGLILPVLVAASAMAAALGVHPQSPIPPITGGGSAAALLFGAVLIAPLGEELFFRGFAYSAWRPDLGPSRALRRSALLFALVHILNVRAAVGEDLGQIGAEVLLQFVVILPAAFLLGFMYERRGLAASLGTHMAYNSGLLALAALPGLLAGG